MKVDGKTFVVTGGGNGMGRELTLLLLKRGARVAAVDMNEAALKETALLSGDLQNRLSTHVVNITERDAVCRLAGAVIQAHGAVDGVINNAGIVQQFVKIIDLDFKDLERVINVNFWGMVNVTKTFLPYLMERPEAHIVNTSSMGGFLPVPGQTAYGASKAAVKLFTEGLHSELLGTNVHVTVVFPGAIATNITANSGVSINMPAGDAKSQSIKMTTAPDAARIILEGIEKNKYQVLVGQDAKMMDFLYRLMPERAARMIYSQMKSIMPKEPEHRAPAQANC
jgi:short-subunit dehydrogenase